MALPKDVQSAVAAADAAVVGCDDTIGVRQWQIIRAHLLSQDAEISNLRDDRDSWLDQASQRLEDWDDMRRRAEFAESRLAAANALLGKVYAYLDRFDPNSEVYDEVESHLQGAGAGDRGGQQEGEG